jgi:hypothetical protein
MVTAILASALEDTAAFPNGSNCIRFVQLSKTSGVP